MMNKDYAIVVKPRIEMTKGRTMPNLKPTLNGIYQYKKGVYTLCNERKNR